MNTIEKALLKKTSHNKNLHLDNAAELLDQHADNKTTGTNIDENQNDNSIYLNFDTTAEIVTTPSSLTSGEIHFSSPKTSSDNSFSTSSPNSEKEKNDDEQKSTQLNSRQANIDLLNLENMGFLVPQGSNSVLNEEYRQIKRPLLNNIQGKSAHPIERANLIQVTSSLQGEGKTFTAINLAMAVAMEMDLNVLLVDADVIKSSVTRTLIGKNEKGLTDYLAGGVKDLSEVLLSTNIPKLKILPAGTRNILSTELLNSQYMEQLISEFSERYDNRVVIIDSPPMLQTNEARILAHKVGQIVFVVEQNKTPQNAVKNALALIDREMVVGLVMNKSRTAKQGGYYGYYGPSE